MFLMQKPVTQIWFSAAILFIIVNFKDILIQLEVGRLLAWMWDISQLHKWKLLPASLFIFPSPVGLLRSYKLTLFVTYQLHLGAASSVQSLTAARMGFMVIQANI